MAEGGNGGEIHLTRATDKAGQSLPPGTRILRPGGPTIHIDGSKLLTYPSVPDTRPSQSPIPLPEPRTDAEYELACQQLLRRLGIKGLRARNIPSNGVDAENLLRVLAVYEHELQNQANPILNPISMRGVDMNIRLGLSQLPRGEQLKVVFGMLRNTALLRQNPTLVQELAQEARRVESIARNDPRFPNFSVGAVLNTATRPFDVQSSTPPGYTRPVLSATINLSAPFEQILQQARGITSLPLSR